MYKGYCIPSGRQQSKPATCSHFRQFRVCVMAESPSHSDTATLQFHCYVFDTFSDNEIEMSAYTMFNNGVCIELIVNEESLV